MTNLQYLAFKRIEKLSQETLNLLPKRIHDIDISFELSTLTVNMMKDNLYEQQDLIEALLKEDREGISDGFEQ